MTRTTKPSHTVGVYGRPDSMTELDHFAFLRELEDKYPAPLDPKCNIRPTATIKSYAACKSQKDKLAFLRHKLATDLRWACRGVVKIHKLQTESERDAEATTDANGVGFSGYDARGMSYIADWINREIGRGKSYAEAMNKPKFIRKLHKTMPKYAGQLRRIADGDLSVPE